MPLLCYTGSEANIESEIQEEKDSKELSSNNIHAELPHSIDDLPFNIEEKSCAIPEFSGKITQSEVDIKLPSNIKEINGYGDDKSPKNGCMCVCV